MEKVVAEELFAGGGEMGALMRNSYPSGTLSANGVASLTLDWSQTLLGPVSEWAQSLKTAVSIILTSRYPMFIWWGAEYANLYNDAYRPILGASKHPQFLGQSAKDCWADVWDVLKPLADSVLTTGQPTWSEDLLLLIDRKGYLEETYFTFSYSPVRDESGGVGGVCCAVTETTGRIIGERRLRTLRKLAAKTAEAKTVEEACHIATTTLSINPHDIPFTLLYRVEPDGKQARLVGTTGIEAGTVASPQLVDLFQDSEADRWNLARVNRTGKAELISDLPTRFTVLPKGVWSDSPSEALVIPIAQLGKAQRCGLLVVGISPRRKFDDDYQGFFDLIASNIATAIANADVLEEASRWLPEEERDKGEGGDKGDEGEGGENSSLPSLSSLSSLSSVSPARILLVDDNADMRDYVRRLLSRDYEVEAVSDRLAVLDTLQRHLPDLVLIDVMLLGLDGLELLRSLRNNPATQNIPIILLSTRAAEESQIEGLEAGADDYLVQPFCAPELLARVRTNLELARLRRETVRYQEQLQLEAQAAQSQVSNILESITDAFVAFDREWRYTYVNEYATRLLRKKREELLGKHVWTEVFPEAVGTPSYWEYHRAVAEQVPIVFETLSQPLGLWIEVNAYPSPDGLALYFRDITHRKQAEQALRESEERFRQLAENIDTVFFMSEGFNEASPGRIAYVSPAYERIWGRSCESLYQNTRSWFEAVHPDDRERIGQALPGIARAEFDVEFRIVRPDGEIRWVHDRVFPIYNERGEIYRTAGIVEDITKRKQIEEALQQQEAQLRLITDTVPVLISFVDAQQRYRFNNRTYEQWFGHPATEVYGKHIRDVLGEPAYEAVLPYVEQVLAGQQISFESEIPYQDGRIRYVSATYVPQFDSQGNVEGYVGLVSDISDVYNELRLRQQAEAALREQRTLLETILRQAADAIIVCDATGKLTFVNTEARRLAQPDPETTTVDLNLLDWGTAYDMDGNLIPVERYAISKALRGEVCNAFEAHMVRQDGSYYDILVSAAPLYNENQQIIGAVNIFIDITERQAALRDRQQSEIALQESEKKLRLATDGANLGLWYWDVENDRLIWNDRAKAMFGLPADVEMTMQVFVDAVHPDDRQLVQTLITDLQTGSVHTEHEYRTQWADGTIRWILARGNSDYNQEGILIATQGVLIDITERKQTEQALRQTEERLRVALQNAPITVFNQDRELKYTWIHNPVLYGLDDMLGKCDRDYLPPDDAERLTAIQQRVLETGIGVREEIKITRNEADYYYDLTIEPLRDASNAIGGITCAAIDVSELKRTEIDLRESESRFRGVVESNMVGIFFWDASGCITDGNEMAVQMLGYSREELQSKQLRWIDITPPEFHEIDAAMQAQLLAAGRCPPFEKAYIRKDGTQVPILIGAALLPGYSDRGVAYFIDITDRKQAQQELQQTLQTLTTLINASPLPIVVIKPNMIVQLWNPAAEQLFGWSEAEVLGQPIPIVPEDKRDECRQVREAVAKGEVFAGVETYRSKRDAATVIVSISAAPLYNEQGSLNAIVLMFQDITQRQRAEEALRQSEERLRLALLVGKAGIWDWDILHNRVTWSEHIYEFHGLTPDTFGGRVEDFAQLIHPDDRAGVSDAIRQALEGKASYELEFRAVQPSGEVRWLSTTGGVIFDAQGQPIRMLGATRDITTRKAIEQEREQLLLSEQRAREEAERANRIKDEFLAVLSHELRSPLNPILGWAKLLQSRTLDEKKTKHALATIERNALLQTQLVEDLLDVSRILRGKLVLNASPVNLASTVEEALETVRLAAEAKGIQIQRVLDPNVGQVMGESARLQQVIWNLLSNAVKFTPSGGTIEIRLEHINSHAQLQVRDTGIGITREFLPYVFEYFRQEDGTTTRRFGGLGLGLAIVRHLVELHGGTVRAESLGEGLGATFTVTLPLIPASTLTPQDNPPATAVAHLTGLRILVVDDQPDIRDIVGFILQQAGATVSVAASAPEALKLMEQSLPDVLVCDIGMPDMDGYMLMRQIRTLPPEQGGTVRAIALTAYAGEFDQRQALQVGFQNHISKPVEPDELVKAIVNLVRCA